MKRRLAALAALLTAGGSFAAPATAQEPRPSAAARLVSVPVSRTETRLPPRPGARPGAKPETVVDQVSYTVIPFNWQGIYFGINAGPAWGRSRSDNTAPFGGYDAGAALGLAVNSSGFTGGGQIGTLWQAGNWVFGPEFDVGYLGLDKTVTVGDDRASARFGWYGSFTGRVGFAWDHALFYLKGGGAVAEVRNSATDLDGAPLAVDPTDVTRVSKTRFGWALGGGVEYGFAAHWSVKAEYLYLDFGTISSTNLDGDSYRHRNAVQTLKFGVNYRLGGVPLYVRY